jgi:hypothetical protein
METIPHQPSWDVVGGLEDRFLACAELSAEAVGCQPEAQPDAERTYKHLAESAAPVSTCKLLINQ